jgi:hypothetical protein
MKKVLPGLIAFFCISVHASAQCTTTNAKTCVCPPNGGINCDLLPDIKVSVDALQSGYTVYTQTGNAASGSQGSNDGRLRLTGTTPNIGYGPLETRSLNLWLCGTDTLTANPGTLCPDGRVPKRFVVQRIYHKSDSVMSYTEVPCGTMTYHPSHGHMHVDNWGIYTLRIQNPNDPDPTHWSIVGTGTKLAFCLLDIGSCNNSNGIYCRDDNNVPKLSNQIPNYTIGNGSYGCSSTLQGISNGWYDSYSSGLDGMWIDIPPGTCNGNYYIVVQIDPNQNMVELNENNNVIAVPVTLSNQTAPGSPVATIQASGPNTLLPGQTITLTANAGTAYSWSTGGATTQSIVVNSNGSYTCTVTNYCGTATSAPFVVTVLPAAPAPVTTGATICSGSTATLTATNGGNGTMKWYNSSSATVPLTTGGSYTTPNLNNTTTYYVENEVTTTGAVNHVGPASNTIGSGAYQTTTPTDPWYLQFDAVSDITLQTVKVYSSTTGNRTFILQDRASTQLKTLTVNIPATGANVITLNWSIPSGDGYKLMVSGTPNLYYNTSGVSFPYLVSGVCKIIGSYSGHSNYTFFYDLVVKSPDLVAKSGRVPVTAQVTSTITVNASATQNSICNGQSVTLSATGATTYSWLPGGMTGSSIVVSPLNTTVYNVTGTTGGCSGSSSVTITVNAVPNITITAPGSICSGATATLTASGASTYLWSTGATTTSINVSPTTTTSYSVTGTSAAGCSSSTTGFVTVNQNPSVSTSATNVNCFGGTNGTATALGSGGTPSYSYSWNTLPVQTTAIASGLAAGSYTVTLTDVNGCTAVHSQTVNQPQPLTGSAVVTNTSCAGNNGAVNFSPSGGTTPYSYLWTPGGASSQDLSGVGPGNYSVALTDANGCTLSQTYSVGTSIGAPVSPTNINGYTYICKGASAVQFTIAPVAGANNYTWSVPAGATIGTGQGTTTLSVNFSATQVSGNLCVFASNGCGSSSSICKALTVTASKPSAPSTISGPATVCANTNGISFSCPVTVKADFYNWVLPTGMTLTSGAGTTNVTVNTASNFTGGYIKVSAGNCFGVSGQQSLRIYSVPTTPPSITGLVNGVCAGSNSVAYSIGAVGGASTYNWTAPLNATIASGQGTNNVTVNFGPSFTSGTLMVTAGNACGISPVRSATVRSVPLTPGTVTGATTACANQSNVPYSIVALAGVTSYLWTAPANAIIASGQGTTNIMVNYNSSFTTGTLKVAGVNSCGSGPVRNVTIKSVPSTPGTITGSSAVCANQSGITYSIAAVSGATSYNWTLPAGASITNGSGTNSITVTFGAAAGNVSVRAVNICGQSPVKNLAVAINCRHAAPNTDFNLYPNPAHDAVTISFNTSEDSRYQITINDITGRKLSEISGDAIEGRNEVLLDISNYVRGVYLISYEERNVHYLKKLVVE